MPMFVFGVYDPELVFHNDREMGIGCKIDAPDLLSAVKCLLDHFEEVDHSLFPSIFGEEAEESHDEEYTSERLKWAKEHPAEVLKDLRNTDQDRCCGLFLAEDSIIFKMMGHYVRGYDVAKVYTYQA